MAHQQAQPDSTRTLQGFIAELLEGAERESGGKVEEILAEWAERELYSQAARLAEGDQSKVAKWLGVSRPTVRERLVRYGIHPELEPSPQQEP